MVGEQVISRSKYRTSSVPNFIRTYLYNRL